MSNNLLFILIFTRRSASVVTTIKYRFNHWKTVWWFAPMAGVTDNPSPVCKPFGAGHAVSAMIIADTALYARAKIALSCQFDNEKRLFSKRRGLNQINWHKAARYQIDNGAQIIDINMGWTGQKVCRRLAGSALLQDRFGRPFTGCSGKARVNAPVTLKTRLPWENGRENILRVRSVQSKPVLPPLPFMVERVRICILGRVMSWFAKSKKVSAFQSYCQWWYR